MERRSFVANKITAALALIGATFILPGCAYFIGSPLRDVWHSELIEPTSDSNAVTVTHMGVTTLGISDGKTFILIDGFFSRPNAWDIFWYNPIKSDSDKVEAGLRMAGTRSTLPQGSDRKWPIPNALFVLHTHYDYAFDIVEIAKQAKAAEPSGKGLKVYGSPSARIILDSGNAQADFIPIRVGQPYKIDDFTITAYEQRHVHERRRGDKISGFIEEPVKQPVRYDAYKQGDVYALKVAYGDKAAFIYGSAGTLLHCPCEHPGEVDTVFMSLGLLGTQQETFFSRYWAEIAKMQPRRVLPIHWDNFTRELATDTLAMRMAPNIADDVPRSFEWLIQSATEMGIEVQVMPLGKPVPLFAKDSETRDEPLRKR